MEVFMCGLGCEYLKGVAWLCWATQWFRHMWLLLWGFGRSGLYFRCLQSTSKTSLTIFRDGELFWPDTE